MVYNTGNYEKYKTKNPLKRKMVNNLNKKIIELIQENSKDNKVYLDAGCGEGFITSLVAGNIPNITIKGLEYTTEAIKIAREANKDIEFIQGDIYNIPFEEKSFDFVLCTEVLEHLENPREALDELDRISKNGILITVPNEPWFCMGNLIALKNVKRLGNPIDHIQHWSYTQFKRMIKEKFHEADIKFYKSFPWSIALIIKNGEKDNDGEN